MSVEGLEQGGYLGYENTVDGWWETGCGKWTKACGECFTAHRGDML